MARVHFDGSEVQMPFGVHVGKPLKDIPIAYLRWVLTIAYEGWLKHAIVDEINARSTYEGSGRYEESGYRNERRHEYHHTGKQEPDYVPSDFKEFALEIVSRGIKACALKYHPDKGGDVEVMKTINQAGDWLRKYLKGK